MLFCNDGPIVTNTIWKPIHVKYRLHVVVVNKCSFYSISLKDIRIQDNRERMVLREYSLPYFRT